MFDSIVFPNKVNKHHSYLLVIYQTKYTLKVTLDMKVHLYIQSDLQSIFIACSVAME